MAKKITQAIILAAGLGTRLRPLTDNIPKVMVPILGKPLLEYHIDQFKRHGVNEFFINLHYLPDMIKNYFGDGSTLGVRIHYFLEKEIKGTAGGMEHFEKDMGESFFLVYGDIFSQVNYTKMANSFYSKPDAIGLQRIGLVGFRSDADLVEINDKKQITKIYPKPHLEITDNLYAMRGIFIFSKKIFKYIPPKTFYQIGEQLMPAVLESGEKFYGYECKEYSKGIDNMEKYREVESYLKNHSLNDKVK